MPGTREEILENRRRLKAEYRQLFDQVECLLFRHDPVGINFVDNTDEYAPETGTILPRLHNCSGADDVCRVAHEEFIQWFGEDTAGPREHYSKIGAEIWQLWQTFRSAEPSAGGNAE